VVDDLTGALSEICKTNALETWKSLSNVRGLSASMHSNRV